MTVTHTRAHVTPLNSSARFEAWLDSKAAGYVAEAYFTPEGLLYRSAKEYDIARAEGFVPVHPAAYRVRVKLKRG